MGRVRTRPRSAQVQGLRWDDLWEVSPTCFFRLSISERSLCISRFSSEISILVVRRSSPCRPADRCSSSYWGKGEAEGRQIQARDKEVVVSQGPKGFPYTTGGPSHSPLHSPSNPCPSSLDSALTVSTAPHHSCTFLIGSHLLSLSLDTRLLILNL